jgi:transcriptional repressor NrdR
VECPYCGGDSRVLDSRGASDAVRRRRQCQTCSRRFTTYERLAPPEIRVLKRDGVSEVFDREKLLRVVARLTKDRPLRAGGAEEVVRRLEADLVDAGVQTIGSGEIAERLLAGLQGLDVLAAARFASNYRQEDGSIHTAPPADTSAQLPLPLADPEPEVAPPSRRRK